MSTRTAWHGTALGWHRSLNNCVTVLEQCNDRFTALKFSTLDQSILVFSLYAPTAGKDEEFLECLDSLSSFILANSTENSLILIGADSNCSSKSSARRQKAFTMFCETFDLEVKSGTTPTFHHHNGSSESQIDMFIASKQLVLSSFLQICTKETPTNYSSREC